MEAKDLRTEKIANWVALLQEFRDEHKIKHTDPHDGLYDWLREKKGIDLKSLTAHALIREFFGGKQ